jgi:methionyl-tRNA formyltransferase
MNAALIGSVSSSAATLRGLLRGGIEVSCVLGLDKKYSKGVSDYHDLRPLAEEADIPFHPFRKVKESGVREFLLAHRPDWLFVVGLSQLVPKGLCEIALAGALGFHPTPLPEGRGRAPVAWTILLDKQAAANLFFLTDEADAGDIVEQRRVPVYPNDYAQELIDRTNVVLEEMVTDLCPGFATGHIPRTPQDHSRATHYPKRTPEDGLIEWGHPVDTIYRLVRAVSHPYPGAFTPVADGRLIIWRAEPIEAANTPSPPGMIVLMHDRQAVVQTGNGLLKLIDTEFVGTPKAKLAIGQKLG